ncbi:hypothetical protein C0Q70_02543 [Pomacea canaliculata]|uniref:Uncharacterized protein n=1 Tax=Pomacea canaliculata TaxID=400727 RepID=A0A2T7PQA9_POMCA|nr:hypothetical protein C0Q70_02543 [Pomacea canaliculata]
MQRERERLTLLEERCEITEEGGLPQGGGETQGGGKCGCGTETDLHNKRTSGRAFFKQGGWSRFLGSDSHWDYQLQLGADVNTKVVETTKRLL